MKTNIKIIRQNQIAHADRLITQLCGFKDEGLRRASHALQLKHPSFHSALTHAKSWRARLASRLESAEQAQQALNIKHTEWLDKQISI